MCNSIMRKDCSEVLSACKFMQQSDQNFIKHNNSIVQPMHKTYNSMLELSLYMYIRVLCTVYMYMYTGIYLRLSEISDWLQVYYILIIIMSGWLQVLHDAEQYNYICNNCVFRKQAADFHLCKVTMRFHKIWVYMRQSHYYSTQIVSNATSPMWKIDLLRKYTCRYKFQLPCSIFIVI